MAQLEEKVYTYLRTVRGMCRQCGAITPARVVERDGRVWQESLCPTCDNAPALICDDAEWYLSTTLQPAQDAAPVPHAHPPEQGCPLDCGPCTWHASPCQLPVISITNACDLDCPICFTYNRPDKTYFMSPEEMRARVDWIVEASGSVDLINITGGEPTQHPQLIELLRCCQHPNIGRITMNSNGLRLAREPELCEQLAALGVCVVLSFNTLEPQTSEALHGRDIVAEKLKAIENLTKAGARMTLLCVMTRGVNEQAIDAIFEIMRGNDAILSLTIQTMTYTGQGGSTFRKEEHIPADEAARRVAAQSKGELTFEDFMTRPSAHPLCYQICYMLKHKDRFIPFTRFIPKERLREMMTDSYLLRLENEQEVFREIIDGLYADGDRELLRVFRDLVKDLYPPEGIDSFERQRRAEKAVRTVYVHAHMDEDTFDAERAMRCPDLVPAEPGRMIPACTYNLFYRSQDERFHAPKKENGE
jgi:7,8-dihydro-6-hydroxymethylpterin dimethyltransferase